VVVVTSPSPSNGAALAAPERRWSSALPSAPAPVRERTSISEALFSRCSLLVMVPRKPSRNDAGIETMPGLDSGNSDQSAFGNIEVGPPETAGEKAIRPIVMISPP
jgi:hypothetical protein